MVGYFVKKETNHLPLTIYQLKTIIMRKLTTTLLVFFALSFSSFAQENIPTFTSKKWVFNYVNFDDKVSSLSGEVMLKVLDNSKMVEKSKVTITYAFGGKTYTDTYIVDSFTKTEEYGFWSLKSTSKTTMASVSIYDTKKYIEAKDLYLAGMVMLSFNDKKTSFYLE